MFQRGTLYLVLRGNTYFARETIKKYGGEFDADRTAWVLTVPKKKLEREMLWAWLKEVERSGVRVEEI